MPINLPPDNDLPETTADPAAALQRLLATLTPREREVLEHFASGLRDADIARKLELSARTVQKHIFKIVEKLGVENRIAAATRALPATGSEKLFPLLTRRENEVLRWLVTGKRDAEMAVILAVSVRTVQKHLQNIFRKLKVTGRADAVLHVIRHEIARGEAARDGAK